MRGVLVLFLSLVPAISSAQVKSRKDQPYPCVPDGVNETIVWHDDIHISYNPSRHIPNWVSYVLSADDVRAGRDFRHVSEKRDPLLPDAFSPDYVRRHGYEVGYLNPWCHIDSNICPLRPDAKRLWTLIEDKCRAWAAEFGTLAVTVATDCVESAKNARCGEMFAPRVLYKAVFAKIDGKFEAVGFVVLNTPSGEGMSLSDCVCSVSMLEYLSDYKMFPLKDVPFNPDLWGVGK